MTLTNAITAKDLAAARAALAEDPSSAASAAPGGPSPICLAIYYGQPDIAEAIADARGDLDIFEAAVLGRADRVRALLDGDASAAGAVAGDGFHALGLAAYFKQPAIVRLLLDRGADPNQAAGNAAKVTALHAAVSSNQLQAAEWLLDAGADVNARQQMDYTPLMGAAANARAELLDLLLARGADPSLATTDGKTAADLARDHGHEDVARRLEA
ncbi:MAG: ankyrin repeat domain-containing protein [Acidobacteriota bacterium]|nr:ankyrin repeat domain-containing protein [Acidobacteriota bacterium]